MHDHIGMWISGPETPEIRDVCRSGWITVIHVAIREMTLYPRPEHSVVDFIDTYHV
jgi:hypothetical protein